MNLAKVENSQVTKTKLPKTGRLADGRVVSNYHLLPMETLLEEGWLPLIDDPPEYDSSTHKIVFTGYNIQEEQVAKTYSVEELPPPPPPPGPTDMEILQEAVADLAEIILFGGEEE